MNPPPNTIPAKINKRIQEEREELLQAWKKVRVKP
jgi:hypothetical protein